jgi:hypothetical protein
MAKLDGVVMLSAVVDVALCPPTVTVMSPVAAPEGITKLMVVAVKLETGAETLPPPWCARVTAGVALPLPVKLVPVSVTNVPSGPDGGLKPVIVGGAPAEVIVAVVELVTVRPLVSLTVRETVKVPALAYACVGVAPVPVLLSPKFHV